MADDAEFRVEVFDQTLARVGWVGTYEVLTVTPRHNEQPTSALTLAGDDQKVPLLATDGARVRIWHRDEFLMSGPVTSLRGEGSGHSSSVTFQVADDWRILRGLLAWQVPGSAITNQGGAEHAVYTGPAETVVKALLTANLARLASRLPIPVTVTPSQGRGSTITVQARMDYPADVLLPLIDQAGIGVTVRHEGSGLVVDCYEPQTWPLTLSEEAGNVADVEWVREAPTATAVVVAGPGEGTARLHRYYTDTAREAAWGFIREVHVDARDIKADDPNFEALMAARGDEALAEGAAKAGLRVSLTESETFRYGGDGVHVGDVVTVRLMSGVEVTDVLREATLAHTPDDGLTVTPSLGEDTSGADAIARAVASLAHPLRKLLRR